MGYVPLFVAVSGRRCAVIGGDTSAENRVRALLAEGAIVTIISPTLTPGLREMVGRSLVRWRERMLMPGDLSGCLLAYCTEAEPAVARLTAVEADAQGVLVNIVDRPELCGFIAPAVVKRGALRIAISTAGASPALSKALRQELGEQFGPSWETLLTALAGARSYLRRREPDAARRAVLNRRLADILRPALLRGDYRAADIGLREELGIGLADLGIELPPPVAARPEPV